MKKILVGLLLFICSCISNNNRNQNQAEDALINEPPYIISLEQKIDQLELVGLTEIGEAISYIPLETSNMSLIDRFVRQIIVSDSHITIRDNNRVLIFDTLGGFLRQIGRKGQGPGEYTSIYGCCFSPDGKTIYLLINSGRSILEYNIYGKYTNIFKLDMGAEIDQMHQINEDLFAFHVYNMPKEFVPTDASLIISDLYNNIQKIYNNYHRRIHVPTLPIPKVPFYFYQGELRYKEAGCDTLYTIRQDELIPYAMLQLGRKEMPIDFYNLSFETQEMNLQQNRGKYWVLDTIEDNDHLYITLFDWINNFYGYYNKYSNTIKIIGKDGFQNDIDGGLPFFPKYVYNDSILVDYVNAFTLREHVLGSNATEMRRLYGQKYDDLVELANSIDDESNPIVVMVRK